MTYGHHQQYEKRCASICSVVVREARNLSHSIRRSSSQSVLFPAWTALHIPVSWYIAYWVPVMYGGDIVVSSYQSFSVYRQSTTSYHVSPVLSRTDLEACSQAQQRASPVHALVCFSSLCTALLDPHRRGTFLRLHWWEVFARPRALLTMTLVRPGPSTAAMRLCRRSMGDASCCRAGGRNGQPTLGPVVPSGEGIAA